MAKRNILVLIDEQVDFTSGVLGNAECLATVPVNVDIIKNGYNGVKFDYVVATADSHDADYLNTWEGKSLPVPHCELGSDGWKLHPDIQAAIDNSGIPYVLVTKEFFASIDVAKAVENVIKEFGCAGEDVDIYFAGVCSAYCVLGNVVTTKALLHENNIYVIKDACACVSVDSHETAMKSLSVYAKII